MLEYSSTSGRVIPNHPPGSEAVWCLEWYASWDLLRPGNQPSNCKHHLLSMLGTTVFSPRLRRARGCRYDWPQRSHKR
jgi:hypothetical protein